MTEEDLCLRLAGPTDKDSVGVLFHAIDRHYFGAAAPSPEAVRAHIDEAVMAPDSGLEIVLAELAGEPVGIATFVVVYPAPNLSGHLFMKDLFVLAEARGRFVGRQLMTFLARLARDRGCSRLDWTAETDNADALAFYDGLAVPRVREKVYYRLDGELLDRFAAIGHCTADGSR